jgi:hypothetical protein
MTGHDLGAGESANLLLQSLANHRGFARAFQPGKLTLGIGRPS